MSRPAAETAFTSEGEGDLSAEVEEAAVTREGPRRTARRGMFAAAAGVTIWVLVAALGVADRHRLPAATPGSFVYAAATRGEGERLWVLDPSTGRVTRGPSLPKVLEIVPSTIDPGSLVVTTGRRAFRLTGLDRTATPVLVAGGVRVGVTPGGEVLEVRRGHIRGASCDFQELNLVHVASRSRAFLYAESCLKVGFVGSDGHVVYLSVRGKRPAVMQLGYQKLHPLLRGYELLSVSPVGDMIVREAVDGRKDGHGAALFWQGRGGPIPIASRRGDLVVERVLAWSRDGLRAAIVGTVGETRSVWTIRAGPGEGRRVPHRIGPTLSGGAQDVGAAFAPDGTVFVAAARHLYSVGAGGRREVSLPEDAPWPVGPLAWIPG